MNGLAASAEVCALRVLPVHGVGRKILTIICRYSAEIEIQFENSCMRIVIRPPRKSNKLMSVIHPTTPNNFIKIRRQRFELSC